VLEVLEEVRVEGPVDDVHVDVIDLATAGGRIGTVVVGPAAVGREAEIHQDVRIIHIIRGHR